MRYKEFNRNKVLEKCIKLFWTHGFAATSISQIVKTTGVNRFSLYAEFNNKEGILYNALKLYLSRQAIPKLQILEDGSGDIKSLEHYFEAFFKKDIGFSTGCFLIFISSEIGKNDIEVNSILKEYLSVIHNSFNSWAAPQGFKNHQIIVNQLTSLYCSFMSYCVILSKNEMADYLNKNLNVILSKELKHA